MIAACMIAELHSKVINRLCVELLNRYDVGYANCYFLKY